MAKYRRLFLEEATEHLSELGSALLELEKDAASVESIDLVFRMSHSIKSMAASLGYDSISQISHKLEDRMQKVRSAGRVSGPEELGLLFKGLEGLERMVEVVRDTGEAPPPDPELLEGLAAASAAPAQVEPDPKKKVLS